MTRIRGRRTRGQSLVEFALVVPIFAIALFGIIDLGRYASLANSLSNGAREAARYASVGTRPSPQCDGLSREACAISVASSNTWGVPSNMITATVTCERIAPGDTTPNPIPVAQCRSNDLLRVHTAATFTLVTPIIAQFIGSFDVSGDTKVVVNQ
jgi:Flp pilus assembly protein TadG